ncbi:MAG: LTA synthase family protein [Clostridia bacterium]|nr:LTA synthase family protein [Clostridia bacterium]
MIELSKLRNNTLGTNIVKYIEICFWLFFTISLFIKCLYFQITIGLNSFPLNSSQNIYMMVSTFAIILILISIVFLFFNKKRFLALLILDILLTFILISDTVYFRYYHNAITVPVLFQIGLIGPLGESIKGLLKSSDLIFLSDLPFMVLGFIFLTIKGVRKLNISYRLICFFVTVILGFSIYIINLNNINTLWFDYDKNHIIKDLGIFYFHFHDTKTYISENLFENKALSEDEKKEVHSFFENRINAAGNYRGVAKGKNVIIIQMEAMQEYLINRKIEGAEITPNLNRLIKDSIYFKNLYYQVGGGNTSDAEFLCNTSQYPAEQGAVYFRYPVNTYHTLPKILKNNGYSSYVFHAYHPSFWNRTVMYKTIGFDTFVSDKDYKSDQVIGFGLNDISFFRQSLKKIERNRPFYGFFVTLSSHYAYAPFKYYEFNVGRYENTDLGNYFKAAHYVDKSIQVMIEELKKQNLYDNTLLVIYGDHHSFPKSHAEDLINFLGINNNDFEWIKNQKVPLIIHCPGLNPGKVVDTTGGQIDILPTVANLLGVNAPYVFGKDLLNAKTGYAILRNGSVVTDRYLFLNENSSVYDIDNGNLLDFFKYKTEILHFQRELKISDIVLEKNAFKNLP